LTLTIGHVYLVRYRRVVQLSVATAIAFVVLVLAGCGSSKDSPSVATAQGATSGSATPSASAPAKETDHDKAVGFARCINEAIKEYAEVYRDGEYSPRPMKDPIVGESLQVPVDRGPAWERCKSLLPATWPVRMDPKEIERDRPFGECLRKRGVYWPEPDADGMMNYSSDPNYLKLPSVAPAVAACKHLLNDPAVRD
jgi:hypothetical protein